MTQICLQLRAKTLALHSQLQSTYPKQEAYNQQRKAI